MSSSTKLNNIQFLRGIAALLVCCFHYRVLISDVKIADFLFSKGSIGVPIFFVISGFIMVYTTQNINLENTWVNVKKFIVKRVTRIVPLYYVLTFCWVALSGFVIYFNVAENLDRLINSLLFLPIKNNQPVLFLGWTLNYEMFFYLLFAISLFFKSIRYYFLIFCFIFLNIINWVGVNSFYLTKMSEFIINYFLIGIVIGLIYKYNKLPIIINRIIVSLSVLFFLFTYFNLGFISDKYIQMLSISLLVLSCIILDVNLKIKPLKYFIYLGNISYSLYLIHPFVTIILNKFNFELNTNILFLLQIIITIILSSISYQIVEKKFTSYLNKKLNHAK